MAIGFGSLGRARGTALYSLTFLIALAIYWSTTTWPSSNDFHGAENFSVNEKASYMLGVAPCPNPNLPLLPVNRPLDPATQTCSHIDLVEDSGFQVEICPVKATCNRFSIIITRQDQDFCSEMEAREFNFTLSAEREDWMRNKQGPDSFSIRTSGAQRWAAEDSVYQGDCKYKFDVTLSNGGPVWLQLWHLYENYSYFDDGVYFMPTNLNKDLLTAPLKLNLCPERCPMSYAPRINAPEPEFPVGAVNTMVEIPDLPECPVEGHLDGIWLQRHPMDVTEPPSKLVYKMVPQAKQTLMGHYEYVAGCKWTHSGRQFVDHTPCTKKPFKIMFAGDSHTRYAMQHFIWRMNGSTDVFPWRGPTFDSYHIDYDQLSIDFKWDPMVRVLLGSWRPEQFLEYDSIVFSAGSWPTKFNLNIEDWMTKTDEFFEKIHDAISSSAKRPILTYLMPTPFPPHNRTTQRDEEHRTNIQLARWRDGFMALCEKYGWRTVDQFTIGMPVNLEMSSADGLHLSPGPSHAWIVDELVGKAGLCQ